MRRHRNQCNPPGNANDPAGKAEDYTSLLQLTPKGKVMATPENLTLIAENDPSLKQSPMTFSMRDTWQRKAALSDPEKRGASTMPRWPTFHDISRADTVSASASHRWKSGCSPSSNG